MTARHIHSNTPRQSDLPQGAPNSKGLGRLRYFVERTFSPLHHFKRRAVRWERCPNLRDVVVSLACGLICWRRLKKARP